MKTIEFNAQIGDVIKKVKVSSNEYGAGGWQILIDDYYHGDVFYKDGGWRAHLNAKSFLTGDDINILGEMIEKESKQ